MDAATGIPIRSLYDGNTKRPSDEAMRSFDENGRSSAYGEKYKGNKQNEDIKDELDAWLAFLSFDEPERIMELIEEYPQFRAMYEEIYQICSNIEGVMNMFSKELLEIDRNTVKYMIEEQEKELEEKNKVIKKTHKSKN